MWHIYNIDRQLRELIDEETGEVFDTEEAEKLQMEREKKIEGLALMEKEVDLRIRSIDQAIKELEEKKEKAKKTREKIIEFLTVTLDGKNFETPNALCKFTPSDRIEVECVDKLPKEYIRYLPQPNKTAIKKALDEGKTVDGAKKVHYLNLKIK